MTKRVLVCPLDWGLGHASRDAGLIRQLILSGFEVIIGADGAPLILLKKIFPTLPYIVIPSYPIKYPKKGRNMPWKMLIYMPGLLRSFIREHRLLQVILKVNHIDIVISDNRYGLWNKSIYCIFMTHQLNFLMPNWLKWMEKPVKFVNYWFIEKYNTCWIPDFTGDLNLTGLLSHPRKKPKNIQYIGALSRFSQLNWNKDIPSQLKGEYDVLVVLSGPEPQRSILEKIILSQAVELKRKFLIVQGKLTNNVLAQSANITLVNHIESEYLAQLIMKIPVIISRSGYSTIMDLIALQKRAILVPTPGQTEQEYLATYLLEKKWFLTVNQSDFYLQNVIDSFEKFQFQPLPQYKSDLSEILARIICLAEES